MGARVRAYGRPGAEIRAATGGDMGTRDVFYLRAIAQRRVGRFQLEPATPAEVQIGLLAIDAQKTTLQQIGRYARGGTAAEGVEHPVAGPCRRHEHAGEQGEGFLRGMFAAGLFPRRDGGQAPHVGHLFPVVEKLHQVIVEIVCLLLAFAGPDEELGAVGEVPAGDIGRRIGLHPRHDVQNLVAQFRQTSGYGEDVVIGARNPYRSVVFQLLATQREPLAVEFGHALRGSALVPLSLVNAHDLSALHTDAAVGEEIGRVGKDAGELEVEGSEQLAAIAQQQGEVATGRFEIGLNHRRFRIRRRLSPPTCRVSACRSSTESACGGIPSPVGLKPSASICRRSRGRSRCRRPRGRAGG